ncbi:MAG: cysteine dioxygenase [Flavobacteriales bacterium]
MLALLLGNLNQLNSLDLGHEPKTCPLNSSEQNHKTYQSLDELVTALSEEDRASFGGIVRSMNLPISDFEPFCSWSGECYTRNCIVENERFELILLCWEEGQKTAIHDHGGEECWVKFIQGEFEETIYKLDEAGNLNKTKSTISETDDISYMIDFMGCHRLENQSGSRAMSLHLYAKPIRNCKIFDENSKEFVRKELSYSTVSEMMKA